MDKKSDHYTSAEVYRDLDGNHKHFTFVDHDKKPTISTSVISEVELSSLKEKVLSHTERTIKEILAMPAVSFLASGNPFAEDYILRDLTTSSITWREDMLRNALLINDTLRYNIRNEVWKHTVKPTYWFQHMSHEDILAGKWKEWM